MKKITKIICALAITATTFLAIHGNANAGPLGLRGRLVAHSDGTLTCEYAIFSWQCKIN
jgi:hypothetical protein